MPIPTDEGLQGLPPEGLLGHLGYTVGEQGLGTFDRQTILDKVYEMETLPQVSNQMYREQWGEPETAKRLKKMAWSIATFRKNHLRQPNTYAKAIRHWEKDLGYLERNFYKGKFEKDFQWPSTS